MKESCFIFRKYWEHRNIEPANEIVKLKRLVVANNYKIEQTSWERDWGFGVQGSKLNSKIFFDSDCGIESRISGKYYSKNMDTESPNS
jgi:hypothetical protein